MSLTAIGLILAAALAHASWNLFSKQASSTGAVFFIWLVAALASVLYAPVALAAVLISPPRLTGLNWLFLAGTGILQAGYFLFLQSGYRLGDLSLVYPVGRGTGALLAAVAGIAVLGERPGPLALAGIVAIIGGIVVIGLPGRRTGPGPAEGPAATPPPAARAVAFALVTGAFVAAYTLWDARAVAVLRTPPLLQGYAAFPVMLLAFAPLVLRDRQRLTRVWRSFRMQVAGAAVLAPLAYILVLAALSFTAVSTVAPAREVSVLFGVMLGRRLLGEGSPVRRLSAAAAIVAGIVLIALG